MWTSYSFDDMSNPPKSSRSNRDARWPCPKWEEVSLVLERTASRLGDGEFLNSEIVSKYVTAELAYVVQLAHERAKVGGSDEVSPIDLRNTMILRPEGGAWKIAHLHGDPITTPRPAESMMRQ